MNLLEVDSIFHSFKPETRLLSGAALSIRSGQIAVLFGRNGTGKTTLLNLICGSDWIRGIGGGTSHVRINGKHSPVRERSRWISILPQTCCLPRGIRVSRCLRLSMNQGEMAKAVARFPWMADLLGRQTHQLSGGESRLVELACVLALGRPFLLLDEPLRQMEPLHIERCKEVLKQEAASRAILLTDHLHRDALQIADRIYLLHGGQVEEMQTADPSLLAGYLPGMELP